MAISTNSIFHFTKSFQKLQGILVGNFKVTYCLEQFSLNGYLYTTAIPMVTFCDIPLSQIHHHIDKYGKYGIGLTKDWAIKNGISPVLYMEDNSLCSNKVEPFLRYVLQKTKWQVRYTMHRTGTKVLVKHVYKGLHQLKSEAMLGLVSFIKNHEGKLFRNGILKNKNYKFYDEREWRYVPDYHEFNKNGIAYKPLLPVDEYTTWRKTTKHKAFIPKLVLPFTGSDIDYIIVKNDSQISPCINALLKCKKLYKTKDDFHKLASRIFSYEKIEKDF